MTEPADTDTTDNTQDIHQSLLDAIEWIAGHHGNQFSPESALRGLPLENGHLTVAHLENAFENIGLTARIVKKRPIDVPLIVCPFMVFFEGGDVGIVTGRRGKRGRYSVVIAGH